MLAKATKLAAVVHYGQNRKRHAGIGIPYLIHPMETMKILWEWGIGDTNMLSAAVCHDILEETKTSLSSTRSRIVKATNKKVLSIVEELTFLPTSKKNKAAQKAEWVKTFADKSIEALVIKVADRVCNLRDFQITDPPYVTIYREKSEPIFEAFQARRKEIAERFGEEVEKKMWATVLTG
jgi:(p)ppGpp synthase/HD superfamily hydrolase